MCETFTGIEMSHYYPSEIKTIFHKAEVIIQSQNWD